MSGQINQHPGHDGGGVEDLHQGEVPKEEIHGGVEGRVSQREDDDQGVSQQGDQVDAEYTPKQRSLEGVKT